MLDAGEESRLRTVRRLLASDIEPVIAIDREITGHSRRGFFAKRLAAAIEEPVAFVSLGHARDTGLDGFALAHLLDGEFGGRHAVGVLDAIGVLPRARHQGCGRALLHELECALRGHGARELRSSALWTDRGMLEFLRAAGFSVAPRIILERSCGRASGDAEWGNREPLGCGAPARDLVAVRSLRASDLPILVGLDWRISGRDRLRYHKRKMKAATGEAGVALSLVAEDDGQAVGFMMARVDYGEFGETEPEAVLDSVGVHPDYAGRRVATAMLSQLLLNLTALRVERVRTEVEWDNVELLRFLSRRGFSPAQRLSFVHPL